MPKDGIQDPRCILFFGSLVGIAGIITIVFRWV